MGCTDSREANIELDAEAFAPQISPKKRPKNEAKNAIVGCWYYREDAYYEITSEGGDLRLRELIEEKMAYGALVPEGKWWVTTIRYPDGRAVGEIRLRFFTDIEKMVSDSWQSCSHCPKEAVLISNFKDLGEKDPWEENIFAAKKAPVAPRESEKDKIEKMKAALLKVELDRIQKESETQAKPSAVQALMCRKGEAVDEKAKPAIVQASSDAVTPDVVKQDAVTSDDVEKWDLMVKTIDAAGRYAAVKDEKALMLAGRYDEVNLHNGKKCYKHRSKQIHLYYHDGSFGRGGWWFGEVIDGFVGIAFIECSDEDDEVPVRGWRSLPSLFHAIKPVPIEVLLPSPEPEEHEVPEVPAAKINSVSSVSAAVTSAHTSCYICFHLLPLPSCLEEISTKLRSGDPQQHAEVKATLRRHVTDSSLALQGHASTAKAKALDLHAKSMDKLREVAPEQVEKASRTFSQGSLVVKEHASTLHRQITDTYQEHAPNAKDRLASAAGSICDCVPAASSTHAIRPMNAELTATSAGSDAATSSSCVDVSRAEDVSVLPAPILAESEVACASWVDVSREEDVLVPDLPMAKRRSGAIKSVTKDVVVIPAEDVPFAQAVASEEKRPESDSPAESSQQDPLPAVRTPERKFSRCLSPRSQELEAAEEARRQKSLETARREKAQREEGTKAARRVSEADVAEAMKRVEEQNQRTPRSEELVETLRRHRAEREAAAAVEAVERDVAANVARLAESEAVEVAKLNNAKVPDEATTRAEERQQQAEQQAPGSPGSPGSLNYKRQQQAERRAEEEAEEAKQWEREVEERFQQVEREAAQKLKREADDVAMRAKAEAAEAEARAVAKQAEEQWEHAQKEIAADGARRAEADSAKRAQERRDFTEREARRRAEEEAEEAKQWEREVEERFQQVERETAQKLKREADDMVIRAKAEAAEALALAIAKQVEEHAEKSIAADAARRAKAEAGDSAKRAQERRDQTEREAQRRAEEEAEEAKRWQREVEERFLQVEREDSRKLKGKVADASKRSEVDAAEAAGKAAAKQRDSTAASRQEDKEEDLSRQMSAGFRRRSKERAEEREIREKKAASIVEEEAAEAKRWQQEMESQREQVEREAVVDAGMPDAKRRTQRTETSRQRIEAERAAMAARHAEVKAAKVAQQSLEGTEETEDERLARESAEEAAKEMEGIVEQVRLIEEEHRESIEKKGAQLRRAAEASNS